LVVVVEDEGTALEFTAGRVVVDDRTPFGADPPPHATSAVNETATSSDRGIQFVVVISAV
jgi:hypothetical protein